MTPDSDYPFKNLPNESRVMTLDSSIPYPITNNVMIITNFTARVSPLGSAEAAAESPTVARSASRFAATEIPGSLPCRRSRRMETNLRVNCLKKCQ